MFMEVAPQKRWTVLIYTSATPDLEQAVTDSLQEICDGPGPPDDIRVVAQMGQDGQARRFELSAGSPLEVGRPEALDMASPDQLNRFLRWGMQAYPAQHYAVVLGGHGAGFAGAVTSTDRRKMLRLPELEEALGGLPARPELVIFNTCLMAQAEVAEQLAPVTSNLVASQSRLTGLGLPLAIWTQKLPALEDGRLAGQALVECAAATPERAPAVGALNLSDWPEVSRRLDSLAREILDRPPAQKLLLRHLEAQPSMIEESYGRPLTDQIDLVSLCRAWQGDPGLPQVLRQRAGAVVDALSTVLHSSASQSHGLSIYAPDRPMGEVGPFVGQIYADLRLAHTTLWDEALAALVTRQQ